MELSTLKFAVDTTELDRAGRTIGELASNIGKIDKSAREAAKTEEILAKAAKANADANLSNAKAQDVRLKSTIAADKADQALSASVEKKTKAIEKEAEATAKSTSILQKQKDILEFQTQGYSKGQSSILAYGKAAGLASTDIEELGKVLETQRKLMGGDPFDKSLSGLKSLQNQYTELKESIRQYNADSDLSSKQTRELARDKERLIEKMKVEGASFSDIRKAVRAHNEDYVKLAGQYNSLMSAEEAVIKNRKEVVAATNYVTQADQKMAAALNESNAAIDKAGTDSLVRYENALRKSGVSQEVATQKLAKYRVQLEQVQKQELARREQHLTRALAPQATDVVVSLWSGQNPLTVLLQQGGQVTDLFMQSGIAAEKFGEVVKKSMASMLPSIRTVVKGVGGLLVDGFMAAGNAVTSFLGKITFFTAASDKVYSFLVGDGPAVAGANWSRLSDVLSGVFAVGVAAVIASLVALGVALKQVTQEQNELVKSLNLTGAALGMSADSVVKFAQSIEGVKTTAAINFIQELSNTSAKASSDLAGLTKVAVDLEKYGGVALKDTAKAYDELQKKPLEGLIKLAEGTGQVSKETVDLAIKLKLAGDEVGLLELANKQFVEANRKAVDSIKQQINPMTALWIVIKDGISSAWEGLKNFARTGIVLETVLGVIRGIAKGVLLVSTVTEGFGKTLAMVAAVISNISAKSPIESFNNIKSIISSYKEDMKDLGKGVKDSWGRINGEIEKSSGLTDAARASNSAYASDSIKGLNDLEKAWNSIEKSELKKITRQQAINKAIEDYTQKNKQASEWQLKLIEQGAGIAWDKAQAKRKEATSTLDIDRTNEIRIIEQSYSRESKVIEKGLNDQLSIAKSKYELGYYTRGQLLAKELELIKNSQKEQKALAEQDLSSREELYVKEVNSILAAYQKRLDANKALKNPEKANAEALADTTLKVQNAYRAWQNFNDIVKDRNKVLDSNLLAKEFEAMKILKDGIKNTTDAIEEFTKVEGLRIKQKNEDNKTEDALRWATPEQAAVIRAVSEETKQYNASLAKLTQSATRAKEILEIMEKGFGKDSSQYQDALDNYEKIVQKVNQANANHRVNVEQAATDAIVKYQKDEYKRYVDGISDSIVTALFEGGKAGSKKLRDVLVNTLRQKVTIVVDAVVNTLLGSVVGSIFGGAGAGGGAGASILGSAAASAGGSYLAGVTGIGTGASLVGGMSGTILPAGMVGPSVAAPTMMSSLGNTLSAIPGWGWALAAVGALAAIFGKKSTPHMGAASSYSEQTGLVSGQNVYKSSGLADVRTYNTEVEKVTGSIAKNIADTLNATARAFGKTAGYEISTAFADDTSKDGAWGSLVIKLGDKIIDWRDTQDNKWAPKEFADGEEGQKQYLAAVAVSTRDALVQALRGEKTGFGIAAPRVGGVGWALDMLMALGDSVTLESLAQAVAQINAFKLALDQMSKNLVGFSGITNEVVTALVRASGGAETLLANANTYYENFYSEAERAANVTRDVTEALAKVGLQMPTTREEFRALVEQQMQLGESGTNAVAVLLGVSGAFATLTEQVEESMQELSNVLLEEVRRLRGLTDSTSSVGGIAKLEQQFLQTANKAKGGDLSAFEDLAKQSQVLDQSYLSSAGTAAEYELRKAMLVKTLLETDSALRSGTTSVYTPSTLIPAQSLTSPTSTASVANQQTAAGTNLIVLELQALRGDVDLLRAEVRADATHNAKTAKILERVTPDGNSLQMSQAT